MQERGLDALRFLATRRQDVTVKLCELKALNGAARPAFKGSHGWLKSILLGFFEAWHGNVLKCFEFWELKGNMLKDFKVEICLVRLVQRLGFLGAVA